MSDLFITFPQSECGHIRAILRQCGVKQCRVQSQLSAVVALLEPLLIHTAQVRLSVKIFARVIIMNDYLAVGADRAGITAFSAASAKRIPVIPPLEPFFEYAYGISTS